MPEVSVSCLLSRTVFCPQFQILLSIEACFKLCCSESCWIFFLTGGSAQSHHFYTLLCSMSPCSSVRRGLLRWTLVALALFKFRELRGCSHQEQAGFPGKSSSLSFQTRGVLRSAFPRHGGSSLDIRRPLSSSVAPPETWVGVRQ